MFADIKQKQVYLLLVVGVLVVVAGCSSCFCLPVVAGCDTALSGLGAARRGCGPCAWPVPVVGVACWRCAWACWAVCSVVLVRLVALARWVLVFGLAGCALVAVSAARALGRVVGVFPCSPSMPENVFLVQVGHRPEEVVQVTGTVCCKDGHWAVYC